MTLTIAIIGRPNVGKSTLFNRLTGKRQALVDDTPGVTRDRREGKASLGGLEFRVIDTAGLEDAESGTLAARMTGQTRTAIDAADAVLLLLDGRAGVTPLDRHFAQDLRKTHKPVVVVINKAESGAASHAIAEAHGLGLGEPVAISAEHGEGMAELYEALAPLEGGEVAKWRSGEEDTAPPCHHATPPLHIAIIGRPNVGKSTLMNAILGRERVLTGQEAGITRDAIAIECAFEGKRLKLVDTAGMRRKSAITAKIEKLAVADTLEALRYAEVAILVIDAKAPLEKQDNAIAALVEQEGRALVLAVNKWDAVEDKPAYLKAIGERLAIVLPQVKGAPLVPISAQTGYHVPKLLDECFKAYQLWNKEISTGALNRWLEAALAEHTPPMVKNRRIKIRYMTQKSARPPTFILFSNTGDIPESYLRYLVNGMRQAFRLPGVPIRLKIRKNKNPYAAKTDDSRH